jgi:DNA-directed RNA polymerase subunit RPC12/RpoP
MPIRHYACNLCGRQLRLEQLKREPDYKACPYCQSPSLYRAPGPTDYPEGGGQTLIAGPSKKR